MKKVLVTGGAGGIGAAICKAFSKEYDVIINYNKSHEKAQALAAELSCLTYQCDVSNPVAVAKMFSEIGSVDILINNAGAPLQKLFTDCGDEEIIVNIETNLLSAIYCAKAALPAMIMQKSGKIINISSMWGICGASCEVVYSAAKAGLIGFTKALAKEAAPSGITVNAIAPGAVKTDMLTLSESDLNALIAETPLGRIGTPEEIASLTLFLASKNADFITGQVISPNGGMVI